MRNFEPRKVTLSPLNLRLSRHMTDQYRELVIMTRPAVVSQRTPGHATIAVSAAGIGEESWGFYPNGVRHEILERGWGR